MEIKSFLYNNYVLLSQTEKSTFFQKITKFLSLFFLRFYLCSKSLQNTDFTKEFLLWIFHYFCLFFLYSNIDAFWNNKIVYIRKISIEIEVFIILLIFFLTLFINKIPISWYFFVFHLQKCADVPSSTIQISRFTLQRTK